MINFKTICLFSALSLFGATTALSVGSNVDKKDDDFTLFSFSLCQFKRCHAYAMCVIFKNKAVCICPKKCPRIQKPVCGTDWKTYKNFCYLRVKSCSGNTKTRLRYNGGCKAGSCRKTRWNYSLRCPYYSKCSLYFGLPRCSCPKDSCSTVNKPVCASDGRTYPNNCAMKKAACQNRKWLRVLHRGRCRPNPCNLISCCCGAVCRVNKTTNHPKCECAFGCTKEYRPVCGSDGKTYSNPCVLRSTACQQQNPKLVQVSNGPCPTSTPSSTPSPNCNTTKCNHFAKCEVRDGNATCVCPEICLNVNNPVCGSDNVTYSNQCELERKSCQLQTAIKVVKRGSCGKSPTCPLPRICLVDCDRQECAKKGQICCCRGCGQVCTTPVFRQGRNICPPDNSACLVDSDCTGGKICCLDGCAKRCVFPK